MDCYPIARLLPAVNRAGYCLRRENPGTEIGGNPRFEIGEDVQVRRDGIARVHIVMIFAVPRKRFAATHDLDAGRIDRMLAKKLPRAFREIVPNDANHAEPFRTKITGRQRNKRGAAAQRVLQSSEWRFYNIERERTDYE